MKEDLGVDDHLFIYVTHAFWTITDKRPFMYSYTKSLTASTKDTNIKVNELNSPTDQIYHLQGIELYHDTRVWLRFRDRSLIGLQAVNYLDQDEAPDGIPWNPDVWMYNYSPNLDIEELIGSAYTAQVDFTGDVYYIQKVRSEEEIRRLKKEETPYLGFYGVHG